MPHFLSRELVDSISLKCCFKAFLTLHDAAKCFNPVRELNFLTVEAVCPLSDYMWQIQWSPLSEVQASGENYMYSSMTVLFSEAISHMMLVVCVCVCVCVCVYWFLLPIQDFYLHIYWLYEDQ